MSDSLTTMVRVRADVLQAGLRLKSFNVREAEVFSVAFDFRMHTALPGRAPMSQEDAEDKLRGGYVWMCGVPLRVRQ